MRSPNTTQIPNEFFDDLLPEINSLSELKVLLIIMRQTFGWSKMEDVLSLTQFQDKTGLSRQGVIDGIREADAEGLLTRRPEKGSYAYHVKVVNDLDQQLVNDLDTQSTTTGNPETAVDLVVDAWIKATGGYINAKHEELLQEYRETYSDEWVIDSIAEMARTLSAMELRTAAPGYILSILKRWARDGKPEQQSTAEPPSEEWRRVY